MKALINTPQGLLPRDVDDPEPAAGQALVAVRAFSVNRGELALLRSRTGDWAPGQDIAGVVVEPAADGSGPRPGDRIAAQVDQAGWAELAAVDTDRLAVLPGPVDIEPAAALPLAGLTALRTLRLGGDLLGRRVLVTGANGGVGRFQVELAAAGGARVTAVAAAAHAEDLRALGASDVVTTPAAADGRYELITESVGGRSLTEALTRAAPGGTIVLFGGSGGGKTPIDVYDFIGHEGVTLVSYLSYAHPEPPGADLARLVDLVARGRLHPTVGHLDSWTRTTEALTALEQRRFPGKGVLTIP